MLQHRRWHHIMKIAIIIRKLNTRGGNQRHVLSLAQELVKRGHRVTLYTFIYSPADCYEDLLKGLDVISLAYYPHTSRFLFFKENHASQQLADRIDSDTEILNPHDQVCYRVAYYYKKRVKNIPSVWVMHDMPTRRFSFMREQEVNTRFHVSLLKLGIATILDWWECYTFIRVQDRIVVLDYRDQEWVKQYFKINAIVVRNGIDIVSFPFIPQHSLSKNNVRLLASGIFFPHRRFEDAIDAVKILHDAGIAATLDIVGFFSKSSAYHHELCKRLDGLGMSSFITFLGKVSEDDLRALYACHNIFIFPNHLQSWGLAVFEAMASGCPVIVSKTAGASEVLTDGEHALLVSPKSPEEIAHAVKRLIDNPNLYQMLSRNGRLFVEQHISWERYTDSLLSVFDSVLKK